MRRRTGRRAGTARLMRRRTGRGARAAEHMRRRAGRRAGAAELMRRQAGRHEGRVLLRRTGRRRRAPEHVGLRGASRGAGATQHVGRRRAGGRVGTAHRLGGRRGHECLGLAALPERAGRRAGAAEAAGRGRTMRRRRHRAGERLDRAGQRLDRADHGRADESVGRQRAARRRVRAQGCGRVDRAEDGARKAQRRMLRPGRIEGVEDPDVAADPAHGCTGLRRACAGAACGSRLQLRIAFQPDMRAAERRSVDRPAVDHVLGGGFDPAAKARIGINAERPLIGSSPDEAADQLGRLRICGILMDCVDEIIETHGCLLGIGHDSDSPSISV